MLSAPVQMVLGVAFREAHARRHAHLTLEHLLFAIAHDPSGEEILRACAVDIDVLRRDLKSWLEERIEKLPKSARRDPKETLAFQRVLQTAVLHVQSAGREEATVGDLIAALLQHPRTVAARLLLEQGVTRLDVLNYISHGITRGAAGMTDPADPDESGDDDEMIRAGGEGSSAARDPLAAYAINLTERARDGQLDPLIGRTGEIRRAMEVLCRRRKNNPVFVGDAGVGKTALVEGLAQRLLADNVPKILKGAEIHALDGGALLAGTRYRGDFEERFKALIAALTAKPKPILFIDEMHTMIGAGATTGGTMDLVNMVKPVLSEGRIRLIGSTTYEEFKLIEKDRALHRRLQKIAVEEPSFEDTLKILKGLESRYEEHHGVTYTDEALEAAARLASRHLREHRLPDSAVDIIDEAGASLRLLEDTLAAEDAAESSESPVTGDGDRHLGQAPGTGTRDGNLGQEPVQGIEEPGEAAASSADVSPDPPAQEATPVVGVAEIERTVARMARIPEKQATLSEKERLRSLEKSLGRVVFGQAEAVKIVSRAIKRSRAGLGHPDHPAGCFLFTGPTGVGKTELARQLARHLGSEFHRFDMSEFMEKHAVARLIGAPPGYVGFEQGGLLVDAVRNHPFSVVLMDEIEKAHQDLFNILLQVMDHGTLTDNNGRKADFRQVVLIMTSNAGSREISQDSIGFSGDRSGRTARSRGKKAIEKLFSPEFRNRIDAIVNFNRLTPDVMETIVEKFILELEAQLRERRIAITLTPEARGYLARKGYDEKYGARPLSRLIQAEVRDPLSEEVLFGGLESGGTVVLGLADGKLTFGIESTSPPAPPAAKSPGKKSPPSSSDPSTAPASA